MVHFVQAVSFPLKSKQFVSCVHKTFLVHFDALWLCKKTLRRLSVCHSTVQKKSWCGLSENVSMPRYYCK